MNLLKVIEKAWGWTGLELEEIVSENEFGNLLLRDVHGKYWRLCPEDVYCKVIAESRGELDALLRDPEFQEDWHMEALTKQAKERLGPLTPGRKYHLATPGVLGGEYAITNVRTIPQSEQIRFSGDIGKQIEGLPEGAQVRLKVIG